MDTIWNNNHYSARNTPLPTIQEITNLFADLPEVPIPSPRPRRAQPSQGDSKSANRADIDTQRVSGSSLPCPIPSSPVSGIWTFVQRLFYSKPDHPASRPDTTVKPNPFVALKTGKKMIVISAVDMGNISFFKFGQGEFSEWPMA
jgi:tRNA-splicing endonuclease subunit Sen54